MLLLLLSAALAMEGMWMPEQVPALAADLRELGIALPPEAFTDPAAAPLSAVVSVGGFCSGSFVSPEGLILTNLHCAEEWLGLRSDEQHDWLAEGFTATDRASELPAGPTARLWLVDSIRDVTAQIHAKLPASLSDAAYTKAYDRLAAELVAACEKPAGYRCRLAAYDGGHAYRLIRSIEIRDVRFVQAPSVDVGYFGGDLDNFEWPRHDGDYAVLRAYVAPSGRPADYSPKNVPYQPRHVFPIRTDGVKAGEAVWVAGFPGNTDRLALYEDLAYQVRVVNPEGLALSHWAEAMVQGFLDTDPASVPVLLSSLHDLENERKYTQGIQDNVAATTLLEDKRALGARLDAAVAGHPEQAEALATLRRLLAEDQSHFPQDQVIGSLHHSALLDVAITAWRWSTQRPLKDLDRDAGFQDRDRAEISAAFEEVEQTLWLPAERAWLEHVLQAAVNLPVDQRITPVQVAVDEAGGIPALLDRLFQDPALASMPARVALLGASSDQLRASTDPWMKLAISLEDQLLKDRRNRDRTMASTWKRAYPTYIEAVHALLGGRAYPDANNTLRLTFGRVEGYSPRDGLVALPQTTLAGLLAKHRLDTYEAPEWLITAARSPSVSSSRWRDPVLKGLPVNFLSSVDTTGGNSGSATLDGQGRLVGLVFDGNYESMSADWFFDPALTRSVHIDIRYILWLLEQQGAGWVVQEMLGR